GKWSFLFFGYTHCPDICPTTLATLARARENIAKSTAGAKDVQFVFISVDPNRDTASNPSITPRRYFWWIRAPDITPCSRRRSMRRRSAGVSKCYGSLTDPKRHEMAASGFCRADIGADRARRRDRRRGDHRT
ncbi:MAG: SCO family protein, partial [Betaproteobacteria bacterium]